MGCRGNFEKLAGDEAHNLRSWLIESLQYSLPLLYLFTMADALKAEGNKAFSAKDYPTAMYVATPPYHDDGY
jgi:hypothetical protein